jgi:hypothetical protein
MSDGPFLSAADLVNESGQLQKILRVVSTVQYVLK